MLSHIVLARVVGVRMVWEIDFQQRLNKQAELWVAFFDRWAGPRGHKLWNIQLM